MNRRNIPGMRLPAAAVALLALTMSLGGSGCGQQSDVTMDRSVASPLTPSPVAVKDDSPPIKVMSGELVYDTPTRSIELKGTQGFRLAAAILMPSFSPETQCTPCVPGDVVALDAQIAGLDLQGTVAFHGKTYPLGMLSSEASAVLVFRGAGVTMPPFSAGDTVTLSAPFQLVSSGGLGSSTLSIPGEPPVRLGGEGIATLEFGRTADVWEFTRAVYEFQH